MGLHFQTFLLMLVFPFNCELCSSLPVTVDSSSITAMFTFEGKVFGESCKHRKALQLWTRKLWKVTDDNDELFTFL